MPERRFDADGIMYHSRMRYLKSRERVLKGPSTNVRSSNDGVVGVVEASSSLQPSDDPSGYDDDRPLPRLGVAPKPCPSEKLIPPVELMTRAKAFRYVYWKHHPPLPSNSIRKMDCLKKKEDPLVKLKRERILGKIRSAEMAAERLRREREARKRAERMMVPGNGNGGGGGGAAASVVPKARSESSENDRDEADDGSGRRRQRTTGDEAELGTSGFSFDAATGGGRASGVASSANEEGKGKDEEQDYPDGFSFLSEWGSQKKSFRW